jgi:hypothetical protein
MTDALTDSIKTAIEGVAAIDDPAERYKAARETRAKLAAGDRQLMKMQKSIANDLHEEHTWEEVGAILGFSGSRAEAVAKGRYTKADHGPESTPPDIEPR